MDDSGASSGASRNGSGSGTVRNAVDHDGPGGDDAVDRRRSEEYADDRSDDDDDAYLAQVADELQQQADGHRRGDSILERHAQQPPPPDFTPRAVLAGLLVGVLLAFTNLYFGLQTGWISMMSLQSALLGYAIFKLPTAEVLLRVLPKRVRRWLGEDGRPFSPQENVVLQTTAVATGTLPLAAGLVGIVPALAQLTPALDGRLPIDLSYVQLVGWSLGICFFGVFLASPLRRQVIVKERLVFPSGTATAQLIALLHGLPAVEVPEPREITQMAGGVAGGGGQTGDEEQGRARSRQYEALPQRASTSFEEQRDGDDREGVASATKADDSDDPDARESMGEKGWSVLGWSFAASAGVTVSSRLKTRGNSGSFHADDLNVGRSAARPFFVRGQLLSIFFPVVFALPVFDIAGALFGVHLAADWLWW